MSQLGDAGVNEPPVLLRDGRLWAWLALMASAVTIANVVTGSRSPTVWQDEVMFCDPAVNFLAGRGWTSTAWPAQSGDETFAGNAPLYPMLLVPWLKVWGVSPLAVRSLNYVLVLVAVLFVTLAAIRLRLVRTRAPAVLLGCLILGAQGVSFSYRSGRYDMLLLCLFAGMFLAATSSSRPGRLALLFLVGMLVVPTGLQGAPLSVAIALVVVLLTGRTWARELVATLAGVGAGGLALIGWLLWQDKLADFAASVTMLSNAARGPLARLSSLSHGIASDRSTLWLAALTCLVILWKWRSPPVRSAGRTGLAFTVVIACAVGLSGKFPVYYGWMVFVPLSIAIVAALDRLRSESPRAAVLLGVAAAISAYALPARFAVTAAEWRARDYAPVEKFVAEQLAEDDRAFVTWAAYYPAKARAAAVYLPSYARLTDAEKRALTIIVADTLEPELLMARAGGQWDAVATLDVSANPGGENPRAVTLGRLYNLVVLRRAKG